MLLVHIVQDLVPNLAQISSWSDLGQLSPIHLSDWVMLAKTFNTDVFADTRGWFDNFMASGQAWALLIGLVIGYILRSLTSYG